MQRAIATSFFICLFALPALAEDMVRYALEKTGDGYVRMDKQSGEMSICKETDGQLVCRLAADERNAYETAAACLANVSTLWNKRLRRWRTAPPNRCNVLPSEEEFDKTLSMMERFFRRFMGVVKELEGERAQPQKT